MTKPQHLALEPLLVLPNKTEEQQNQTMAILCKLRLESHTFHLLSERKFLIYGGSVRQGDLVLIRESSKKHIGQMGGHLLKSSFMTTILFCITFSPPHHLNTRSLYKSSGFSKWSSNIRGPLFKLMAITQFETPFIMAETWLSFGCNKKLLKLTLWFHLETKITKKNLFKNLD